MKFAFHAERALPCIPTFRRLFCSLTSCLYKYSILQPPIVVHRLDVTIPTVLDI